LLFFMRFNADVNSGKLISPSNDCFWFSFGENCRLIYDILHFTEENDIPGILLLIDFEKAFDSISWSFIYDTLKFFNFGESVIE
jgi:hypothetical protein